MNRFTLMAAGAVALAAAVACGPEQASTRTVTPAGATSAPAVTPAAAPAAVPSPDGTYSGSCDYILSGDFNGYHHLVGEVDERNTGNIGLKLRVKITWPQEGSAPVVAVKHVRVAAGARRVVRFRVAVPASGNVIDLLQSWQEHHGYRDGCGYDSVMTGTYGSAG